MVICIVKSSVHWRVHYLYCWCRLKIIRGKYRKLFAVLLLVPPQTKRNVSVSLCSFCAWVRRTLKKKNLFLFFSFLGCFHNKICLCEVYKLTIQTKHFMEPLNPQSKECSVHKSALISDILSTTIWSCHLDGLFVMNTKQSYIGHSNEGPLLTGPEFNHRALFWSFSGCIEVSEAHTAKVGGQTYQNVPTDSNNIIFIHYQNVALKILSIKSEIG